MKRPSRFEAVGLPEGHAFPRLAFHRPTQTVIAHTRPRESPFPGERLSVRHVKERLYRSVGDFPPGISLSSFAVASKAPLLYFISFAWSEFENGPPGGDWDTLCQFRLDTSDTQILARRGELIAPQGYDRAWLSELLSADDDGVTLCCKVGLSAGGAVEYWICELLVVQRTVTPVTRLEATFA